MIATASTNKQQSTRPDGGGERTLELAERVLAPTYARPPRLFVAGEGATLVDADGRRYLDMTSGIAVNALGHGSPTIREALHRAADGLIHVSNLYHTAPAVALAAALVERSFADRVFFANSGAEAVEGALKLARLRAGAGRSKLVSFDGSFHGRTFGALAATDRPAYQRPFEPLPRGFVQARLNDLEGLTAIDGETAAAIVEPLQGEAGVRLADDAWLAALRRRCDEVGALLIFDEVQCGLGRTGRLWGHEHSGVLPDLMTLAKPLAGGLPMGAVLMTEAVAESVTPGCHATTFGGGPLVASVALAVFEQLCAPGFLAEVDRKGRWLRDELRRIDSPLVDQVRGRGLLVGVRLSVPPAGVVQAALEEGLLVVPAGDDVVRFVPPLNCTREELARGVALFDAALGRVAREEQT